MHALHLDQECIWLLFKRCFNFVSPLHVFFKGEPSWQSGWNSSLQNGQSSKLLLILLYLTYVTPGFTNTSRANQGSRLQCVHRIEGNACENRQVWSSLAYWRLPILKEYQTANPRSSNKRQSDPKIDWGLACLWKPVRKYSLEYELQSLT